MGAQKQVSHSARKHQPTTIILFSQHGRRPPIHFRRKWKELTGKTEIYGASYSIRLNGSLNMSWKQLVPLMRLAVEVYVYTPDADAFLHTILARARQSLSETLLNRMVTEKCFYGRDTNEFSFSTRTSQSINSNHSD